MRCQRTLNRLGANLGGFFMPAWQQLSTFACGGSGTLCEFLMTRQLIEIGAHRPCSPSSCSKRSRCGMKKPPEGLGLHVLVGAFLLWQRRVGQQTGFNATCKPLSLRAKFITNVPRHDVVIAQVAVNNHALHVPAKCGGNAPGGIARTVAARAPRHRGEMGSSRPPRRSAQSLGLKVLATPG